MNPRDTINPTDTLEVGTQVQVYEDHDTPYLRGQTGIVTECYGHCSGGTNYAAFDVRLENGKIELFWRYQLEPV